jgi:hypothetical protein
MTTERYPNGYQEKIDWYTYKVNKSIKDGDSKGLLFYAEKLSYFMQRQRELNRKAMGLTNN